MSQIGRSHLGASWYVFATSRFGQCHLVTFWNIYIFRRPKLVIFIYVLDDTSLKRLKLVSLL